MNKLAILAVLAACIAVSHGLKCYVCNETALAKGDTCADPFDIESTEAKGYLVTCTAPADKFCMKEKTGSSKLIQNVVRACANQCEDYNAGVIRKDCCEKDGCNTATSLWSFSPLLIIAFASLVAYFK